MLWLWLLCTFYGIWAQTEYEVPDATVEAYSPKGFKVSIPYDEGTVLFAFHGKINEEMNGREAGTFSRDILKPKDGRWIFYEPNVKLKVGDVLYYWTYVQRSVNQQLLGYPKDDQKFEVKELVETTGTSTGEKTTNAPVSTSSTPTSETGSNDGECEYSETRYNNGRKTCKGKLIFTDTFTNEVREKSWTVEQKFAGTPDYEFVIYVNRPETLKVRNRNLKISPVPLENIYGEGFINSKFDLGENCTGVQGSPDCVMRPDAGFILHPVLSSRISTKSKFSFKYGKIEIRAKLPKGDWIYPELYLNSENDDYGLDYDSGQIRIAFTPGNSGLNEALHGGVILGSSPSARTYGIKTIEKRTGWTNEFHRFAVTWKPESITLSVDDKVYGTIFPPSEGFASLGTNLQIRNAERWKSGTHLAPFDKEMYITVGVGVAGFNFEDKSDGTKPWKNGARSSIKDFYKAQSQWAGTWDESSTLVIDYVKVWGI